MGVTHFDEAEQAERAVGHLRARWSFLGDSAGSERAGVRRIEVPAGGWSTPAHQHGVAHVFRAGDQGLTFLAYGLREAGDMCYYPRSRKIAFRGLGVMGRIEEVRDYWDGED
jgi:uncharacterized cupin superfamily protein